MTYWVEAGETQTFMDTKEKKVNILTKLATIQQEIKVPKDLNNEFAGFKYRSAEGILEKLKPILDKHKATVLLSDTLVFEGEQYYIQSCARFLDLEAEDPRSFVETYALAREEKFRPKMSEGQLTGAASSYARKYALNGLLLLDDEKNDPDSRDNSEAPKKAQKVTLASPKSIEWIRKEAARVSKLDNQEEIDNWVEAQLTLKPEQIPQTKVKAAVDKIRELEKELQDLEKEANDNPIPELNVTEEDLERVQRGEVGY